MQEKDGIMVRIKDIINGATDAERDRKERLIRQTTCFNSFCFCSDWDSGLL